MSYFRTAVLLAALSLSAALLASPAAAHEGDPHYRSVVTEIAPPTDGLTARVLDHDDALLLVNDSGKTVVVLGADGEPYARLLADGTVQVNSDSAMGRETGDDDETAFAPRLYASVDVRPLLAHGGEEHAPDEEHAEPGRAPAAAQAPRWTTLDRAGRLQWHDPRINYRAQPVPPQVTDEAQETKIKDWRVPLLVAGQAADVLGTLTWVGEPDAGSSFPTAAVISLAVLALLAVGAVVLVRRRRAAGEGAP
jgi:MYXO-CTERM domain-containing protein